MRLLLARHGETPWNAEGRYQGQEDIALSATGEAQARALGERLRGVRIDRAVSSPLARARRTAELALGEARAPMLSTDPGLMEIAHGEWEGLLAAEAQPAHAASAATGSGVASTIARALARHSSRLTTPSASRRPREKARPALVVARAWKPSWASIFAEPASHGLGRTSRPSP